MEIVGEYIAQLMWLWLVLSIAGWGYGLTHEHYEKLGSRKTFWTDTAAHYWTLFTLLVVPTCLLALSVIANIALYCKYNL